MGDVIRSGLISLILSCGLVLTSITAGVIAGFAVRAFKGEVRWWQIFAVAGLLVGSTLILGAIS